MRLRCCTRFSPQSGHETCGTCNCHVAASEKGGDQGRTRTNETGSSHQASRSRSGNEVRSGGCRPGTNSTSEHVFAVSLCASRAPWCCAYVRTTKLYGHTSPNCNCTHPLLHVFRGLPALIVLVPAVRARVAPAAGSSPSSSEPAVANTCCSWQGRAVVDHDEN